MRNSKVRRVSRVTTYVAFSALFGQVWIAGCGSETVVPVAEPVPLHAFDFTISERPAREQVQFLKDLGYGGIVTSSSSPERVTATGRASGEVGIRYVASLWMMELDKPLDRELLSVILPELARCETLLWVMFGPQGKEQDLSSSWLAKLRELADLAEREGIAVVLYPHDGTPLTTAEQALQWLKQIDKPNVRLSLHLCHEIKARNTGRLTAVIQEILPHLAIVTVNGADPDPEAEGWSTSIQPLDAGSLDVRTQYVQPLMKAGFKGPVVLHTYGLNEPPEEHYARSIAIWNRWQG